MKKDENITGFSISSGLANVVYVINGLEQCWTVPVLSIFHQIVLTSVAHLERESVENK